MNSFKNKAFLSGNLAILRGALEAGVRVVSSYPGGPVTEILENSSKISKKFGLYCEWSTNEKVALEVGIGASLAGQRALVAVKDVGLNSALDTLLALSRGGCNAGLVIVVGNNGHASPNMQDCRYFFEMSHLMAFDPADPQEAKEMTFTGFNISELLELPVIINPSSHICYGEGEVNLGEIRVPESRPSFRREESTKYISVGHVAPERVEWLHKKTLIMRDILKKSTFNSLKFGDSRLGIIVAGHMHHLLKKSLLELNLEEEISVLKIGTINPLPVGLVINLVSSSDKVLIIEELEPFLENKVLSILGRTDNSVEIKGKLSGDVPIYGFRKMSLNLLKRIVAGFRGLNISLPNSIGGETDISHYLCEGCPHEKTLFAARQAVKELGESDCVITGDQGCSLLLSLKPNRVIDTEYHMGSSIGVACGLVKGGLKIPVIAAIGDSSFFHNGVSALINAVYNEADITVLVLDNSTTAMTGLNPNPSSGRKIDGSETKVIKIEDVARGCGVESVSVVNPTNIQETIDAIKKAIIFNGPALVVSRGPCVKVIEKSVGNNL